MNKPLLSKPQLQALAHVDLLQRVANQLPVTTPTGRRYAIKAHKAWFKFLKTK
jgi:hypothetical protein